ncbi:hypothetical protein [Paenibacillus rhizovicinus]|nr:hypothetical protein [Paenibacillus rhizovicinus]
MPFEFRLPIDERRPAAWIQNAALFHEDGVYFVPDRPRFIP